MWASRTAVAVLLLLLVGTLPLLAGEPPVPIEGKLLISAGDAEGVFTNWVISGSSDNVVPLPEALSDYHFLDPSPLEDEYAYTRFTNYNPGETPWSGDIGRVGMDGSAPVALTALAGLGGLNCGALWSPDASQLAFTHADPAEGEAPCTAGFEAWIINADGSGLRRVSPVQAGSSWPICWAPNGYRLVCKGNANGLPEETTIYVIDSDGTDYALLWTGSQFGNSVWWSPDGSKILVKTYEGGEWEGEDAHIKRLLLCDPDGGNPQEVFRNGITLAELAEIIEAQGLWGQDAAIIIRLAPYGVCWSPRGDRIVFGGAMEYDPYGATFNLQSELWMYEMGTEDITQITSNLLEDCPASWDGYNTFDYDPEVTVDNTTVLFDEVLGEGLTTIIRDDDLPELPSGFMFAGESYRITTTATPSGTITVRMTYLDEFVPSGVEETLCIYHWDADAQDWEDITVSRDPVNNIVIGVSDSLSPFGMVTGQRFGDILFSHWAYQYIEACARAGIVGGYPGGFYLPDLAVSRDQMAVFISRALAGGDGLVPTGPVTATFSDVLTDHWAFKYVEYAVDNGVVAGYEDGTYRPDDIVTRDQMAVFVARAMVGGDAYVPTGPETAFFPDVLTDHWAFKYVEYIRGEGVTGGYPDGNYHPEYEVTRDQMAVFVQRAFALPM